MVYPMLSLREGKWSLLESRYDAVTNANVVAQFALSSLRAGWSTLEILGKKYKTRREQFLTEGRMSGSYVLEHGEELVARYEATSIPLFVVGPCLIKVGIDEILAYDGRELAVNTQSFGRQIFLVSDGSREIGHLRVVRSSCPMRPMAHLPDDVPPEIQVFLCWYLASCLKSGGVPAG
jgi:hypothetical protein